MLFYRAALPLSRHTLNCTAGAIRRRRRAIRSCWRSLNPDQVTWLTRPPPRPVRDTQRPALRGRARAARGCRQATAAGATYLWVQTEPASTAALQLYRTSGFPPVHSIEILVLLLHHNPT